MLKNLELELRLENIEEQAKKFLLFIKKNFPDSNCLAFYGKMGIGKTTFIKAVCKQLDVVDTVTSPTFAIINEYKTNNDLEVYHFDFYRINKIEEAFDFGYEEYFYSKNYCLIEWPELVEDLLPENFIKISLSGYTKGISEKSCLFIFAKVFPVFALENLK